jgi:hypothetical protein
MTGQVAEVGIDARLSKISLGYIEWPQICAWKSASCIARKSHFFIAESDLSIHMCA